MPFELQPTLRGTLLDLRPMRPDDFDALYAVARDPLIWEQHSEHDRWTEARFRVYFQGGLDSGGGLVAIDRSDTRIIGASRYHGHDESQREIEIGWTFLARSHWGGRHNGEMKSLMLQHAFRFVDRVLFLIGPDNVRSQRAVERIGGTRIGSRRDAGGRESLVFAIVASDWAVRRGNPDHDGPCTAGDRR